MTSDCLVDDVTRWPSVDLGKIFSYILKIKEFDAEYVGKYKDQKGYSYYQSGFVGTSWYFCSKEISTNLQSHLLKVLEMKGSCGWQLKKWLWTFAQLGAHALLGLVSVATM